MDIVERLREGVKNDWESYFAEDAESVMTEAANEIERLRKALQRIVDIDWQFANSGTLERIEGRCAVIARAALKEQG